MNNNKPEVISSTSVLDKTGFEWENNDCVVRAMAIAADTDYPTAHKWVKENLKRPDREGTSLTAIKLSILSNAEVKINNKHFISISSNDLYNPDYTHKKVQYTVGTFSQKHNKGTYFILVRGHALTIKDGVIYDNGNFKIRNNGFRRPIRNAFKFEETK
jgi:hypothetical protein